MTFILHRKVGKSTVLNDVRSSTLRIGRGTNAELRSENPAVALEHAVIEENPDGYTLVDRGSITGTYLNGKPVDSIRVSKGDVIEIGDIRMQVQMADPGKPLFLRVDALVAETQGRIAPGAEPVPELVETVEGAGGQLKAPKIDYVAAYRLRRPLFSKSIVALLAVILASAALISIIRHDKTTNFMPGGVSSAHARVVGFDGKSIGGDCASCHDPWHGVVDDRCATCHSKLPHAETQASTPACITCHTEHREFARLASVVKDTSCTSCHENLDANTRGVARFAAHTTSFGSNHPEFALPVKNGSSILRVAMSDSRARQADPDTLAFNHQYHMQNAGVLGANGAREKLNCESCHSMVNASGKTDPAPVNFEASCQRCHQLTFDSRFPTAQVPHGGDPAVVYGAVMAVYAGNQSVIGKSPDEVRRILTRGAQVSTDQRALVNAEQVIKTKCSLCHELVRKEGRINITPPVIRTRWFEHARFSHTAHLGASCESCHQSARQSIKTSDVNLPGRDACVGCHGGAATAELTGGKGGSSNCTTCHFYHERSKNVLTKMAAPPKPVNQTRLERLSPSTGQ